MTRRRGRFKFFSTVGGEQVHLVNNIELMQTGINLRIASLLCVISLGLSGCYTPPKITSTGRYFRESASADVVLVYYRWDHIFIARPEYRDKGFQRPLTIDELDTTFDTLNVTRGTAVVLVVWNYDPIELQEITSRWKSVLAPAGFRRIVHVYGRDDNKLDGAPIIDEWIPPVEQTRQTATR